MGRKARIHGTHTETHISRSVLLWIMWINTEDMHKNRLGAQQGCSKCQSLAWLEDACEKIQPGPLSWQNMAVTVLKAR